MANQFIVTGTADETVEPVNLSFTSTFRKGVDMRGGGNVITKYTIEFYGPSPYGASTPISWKYKTEEARNCDYKRIVNLFALDINLIP